MTLLMRLAIMHLHSLGQYRSLAGSLLALTYSEVLDRSCSYFEVHSLPSQVNCLLLIASSLPLPSFSPSSLHLNPSRTELAFSIINFSIFLTTIEWSIALFV